MNGTTSTTKFSQEFAGLVIAVGSQVQSLAVGDSVLGISPGGLSTQLIVSPALCQRFEASSHIDYLRAATVPAAYATAIHALTDLARISDEDVSRIYAPYFL